MEISNKIMKKIKKYHNNMIEIHRKKFTFNKINKMMFKIVLEE